MKHQFQKLDNSSGYVVWPIGKKRSDDNTIKVNNNKRCGCSFQMTYQCPCPHEFCIETKFNVTEYSSRWLNNSTYRETFLGSDEELHQSDESLVSDTEMSLSENQISSINETDHGNDNESPLCSSILTLLNRDP